MAPIEPPFKGEAAAHELFVAWELRAARAAADISAQELADLAGVHVNTIRRAEKNGMETMSGANQNAISRALKALGIVQGRKGDFRTISYQPAPKA